MLFAIYTILVILQQYKGMTTEVPDPCPSTIVKTIETPISDETQSRAYMGRGMIAGMIWKVADMCKSSSATEETNAGSDKVDSVVLRIMTQQDDCICRVTIDNQIEQVYVSLRKYEGLTASAPEEAECGLAIDINHIPRMTTENGTAPIKCIYKVNIRYLPLLQNSTLQFKSRIINGSFTRGYCMRIIRDITTHPSQKLKIHCDAPMTKEKTTENTITYHSTPTAPTTDDSTTTKQQQMTTPTDPTAGLEQTTYIAIGAGSGVALILLVVLLIMCIRRKSTQNTGTNEYVNNSQQQEESDDKLPDNLLYVPAEEFDITGGNYSTADVNTPRSPNKRLSMEGNYSTVVEDIPKPSTNRLSMDGNYSTVELDEHLGENCSYPENSELGQSKGKQKPTIKPKPKSSSTKREEISFPDQNIKYIIPPNSSDNVYAVVDKSSKNVPTANGGKGEGSCQPDQTYAVVDKARKPKSSPDETNKKKFEINYGNRV